MRCIQARTSRDHFFSLFLSLCIIIISIGVTSCTCLFTEVKQQWAVLVLGWATEFYARYGRYLTQDFHNSSTVAVSVMAL